MAKAWRTLRIPADAWERHRRAKRERSLTWGEYIDAQAPDPPSREDVLRQSVREGVEAAVADADLVEGEPEPLEPLAVGTFCNVCDEDVGDRSGTCAHLLKEHAGEVNAFMAEVRARQNGNGAGPEREGGEESDAPFRVHADGPLAFGEVPVDRPGQSWGNGTTAARECDACGRTMSKSYGRVFAQESGVMKCPDCASRSQRYSMAPALDSDADGTDPGGMTGQLNPNSAVPRGELVGDD